MRITKIKYYDRYIELSYLENEVIVETKKICKTCGKEYFNRGECSKELTCEDVRLLYNNGKPLNNFIICKQCQKPTFNIKAKDFCSIKCYDRHRYVNNINGRRDKMKTIMKLRKNRLEYIKKLSAQQLLEEVQEDNIWHKHQ